MPSSKRARSAPPSATAPTRKPHPAPTSTAAKTVGRYSALLDVLGCAAGSADTDPDDEDEDAEESGSDQPTTAADAADADADAGDAYACVDVAEAHALDEASLLAAAEAEESAAAIQRQSAAYSTHYDVEWTQPQLETRAASLKRREVNLAGIGAAALTSPDSPPPDSPPPDSGGVPPPPHEPAELPERSSACLAAAAIIPPLRSSWAKAYGATARLPAEGRALLSMVQSYRDVLLPGTSYEAYAEPHGGLMRVIALHGLQHAIVASRHRLRGDKNRREAAAAAAAGGVDADGEVAARDQGFTRPTVLVLLPMRSMALHFVNELLALLPSQYEQVRVSRTHTPISCIYPYSCIHPSFRVSRHAYTQFDSCFTSPIFVTFSREFSCINFTSQVSLTHTHPFPAICHKRPPCIHRQLPRNPSPPTEHRPCPTSYTNEQVENKSRFLSEFEEEGETTIPANRPDDYKRLFEGNVDDNFRCSLRLTRKSIKMYASFYNADIVIGSPIGLRLNTGAERDQQRDTDWLSSIEVVLAPYADVFLMQNWEHVHEIFTLINRQPTQQRETDFTRVRSYHLDGTAARVRQTGALYNPP